MAKGNDRRLCCGVLYFIAFSSLLSVFLQLHNLTYTILMCNVNILWEKRKEKKEERRGQERREEEDNGNKKCMGFSNEVKRRSLSSV